MTPEIMSSAAPPERSEARRESSIVVASTATSVPPHVLSRDIVKEYFGRVFGVSGRRLEAILSVVDNSRIDRRYTIFPVDYLIEPRPLLRKSTANTANILSLWAAARRGRLSTALHDIAASDVDMIVTVSARASPVRPDGRPSRARTRPASQRATPADYRTRVRRRGRRTDARVGVFARVSSSDTVLLVAVELPSLTFQRQDLSQANLISTILFGDGAAAAVITGRPASGPAIQASESYLFPNSIDAMGFDLRDEGFHIVLSKEVPELIRERIGGLVDGFLARHSLTRSDMKAWVLHPGGQKLLAYLQEELGLGDVQTEPSWKHAARLRQSFERVGAVRLARVAGARRDARGRPRIARCVWPGLQRRNAATAMDLSVILYLALLAVVGLTRLLELRILAPPPAGPSSPRGIEKRADPRFTGWMVWPCTRLYSPGRPSRSSCCAAPPSPIWRLPWLCSFCWLATTLRWWVIQTMGAHWNVEVMASGTARRGGVRPVSLGAPSELSGCVCRTDCSAAHSYCLDYRYYCRHYGECLGALASLASGGVGARLESGLPRLQWAASRAFCPNSSDFR